MILIFGSQENERKNKAEKKIAEDSRNSQYTTLQVTFGLLLN